MEYGQLVDIPHGNSDRQKVTEKIKKKDYGPKNRYTQDSDPSCLFTSLANALVYIRQEKLGQKLIEIYYNEFRNQNKSYVTMNDVLNVTSLNGYHSKFESKFRFEIKKVKQPNAMNLLPPTILEENNIFHCILSNHHSIAICNNLIFDPSLSHSILRNEANLRSCAEANKDESTSNIILKAYEYIY